MKLCINGLVTRLLKKIGAIYGSVKALLLILHNVYFEKTKGVSAFRDRLKKERKTIIAFEKRYESPVVDTAYNSLMDLLNPNSYQKGGWILHMLRNELGDEAFHQTIRTYYQKYRLSNADTKDFQKLPKKFPVKTCNGFLTNGSFIEDIQN